MTPYVRFTVNCEHNAFQQAMTGHMPNVKFHEVHWRDTERMDEDGDTFTTFSWPNKRHPELTKNLFFTMAFECLASSNCPETAFYIEMFALQDGKQAVRFDVGWNNFREEDNREEPTFIYKENLFSQDMASRLSAIEKLANGRED